MNQELNYSLKEEQEKVAKRIQELTQELQKVPYMFHELVELNLHYDKLTQVIKGGKEDATS